MSAAIATTAGAVVARPRSVLWQLTAIEARWMLRRLSLWLAFLMVTIINLGTTADWQSGSYTERIASITPLAVVAFVAGLRSGSRDAALDGRTFGAAAPVGPGLRTLARFAALGVPAVMAASIAVAIGIGSRIEGGFWIGDSPRRIDTALHPWTELLQLPLAVVVIGGFGLLLGSVAPRRFVAPIGIAGTVIMLLGSAAWWVWNIPPMHSAAIIQVQPLFVDLPDVTTVADTPSDWLVEYPNEFGDGWRRLVVHRPTIIAHDLYLAALAAVLCGLAVRSRRALMMASGAAVVAVACVAFQVAVYPGS